MKGLDEEDIDEDINEMLDRLDHIDLTDLSPANSYDDIRYSHKPQINPHASFSAFNEGFSRNLAFALNFSAPPIEFKEYAQELIENTAEIGVDIDKSAEKLAETALEAGEIGLRIQGGIGYILMSHINEDYDEETFKQESDIPSYFLEENELNSKYYQFEGTLNEEQDMKIASITEDTTAIAWFLGRVIKEFEFEGANVGKEFKDAYDKTVEDYILENYPERL